MKTPRKKSVLPVPSPPLQIAVAGDAALSSQQQEFNHLTAQIAALRAENALLAEKLDALLRTFYKHLLPAYEAVAQTKLALAAALEAASFGGFGKQQLSEIGTCIVQLCVEAFAIVSPSPEDIALHDRWAPSGYAADCSAPDDAEQSVQDMPHAEPNPEALQNDPEAWEQWRQAATAKLKEQHRASKQHAHTSARQRAETAKTDQAQAAAALKARSVRSIYISLAKLIHPDTELDPTLRTAKEEEMKLLAAAYAHNDLATLLKMELDWMHQQTDRLGQLATPQLTLYNQVLQDQVQQLQAERTRRLADLRQPALAPYATGKLEAGLRAMKADAKSLLRWVAAMEGHIRSLATAPHKSAIAAFVKDMLHALRDDRR